jgi:hypothetical protein
MMPDMTIWLWIGGIWVALAILAAWFWMRWHQWLRGDFDKPHG